MRTDTHLDYKERFSTVVDYIRDNLDQDMDLERLALVAGLSSYHFQRVFQAMLGESPSCLLRRLRLERAASELGATRRPISQIALRTRYATYEAFLRAFRTTYGAVPSAYRKHPIGDGGLPCSNRIHFLNSPDVCIRFTTDRTPPPVEIREVPPRRVISIPHKGDYWKIGQTFGFLRRELKSSPVVAGPTVAIFYSSQDSCASDAIMSEAGALIADELDTSGTQFKTRILAGGTYAVATHMGAYDDLGHTWEEFYGRWLPSSGRVPDDYPTFEVYVDDCNVTPIQQCRTELYLKLKGEFD